MIHPHSTNATLRRTFQSGFTILEVALGLVIAVMMICVFCAVFPMAVASSKFTNNYAQADMIVQQKIDELHMCSWSGVTNNAAGATLLQTNMNGLIDSGSCNNAFPMTCSFTDTDNLVNNGTNTGYFPAGSTGTITISPDTSSSSIPSMSVFDVVVTVTWTSAGVSAGSFTSAAKMIEMTHE